MTTAPTIWRPLGFRVAAAVLACLPWAWPAPVLATPSGTNGKLFFQDLGTTSGIFSMNPDGSGLQNLTPGAALTLSPLVVSPQGNYVAYIKNNSIHMMAADGSGDRQIGPANTYGELTWSPDGSALAVADSNRDGLYLLDLATGSYDLMIDAGTTGIRWSAAVNKIAFSATGDIYTLDMADGSITQLTNTPADYDFTGDWSPDGSRIAFISDRPFESRFHLYFMKADGTGETAFDTSQVFTNYSITEVAWSPDGTKIAYLKRDDGADASVHHPANIYITSGTHVSDPTTLAASDVGFFTKIDWQATGSTPYVYRFWSPTNQHHFYTGDFGEAVQVMTGYPDAIWTYEGVAYQAPAATNCTGKQPVYRFWSHKNQGHFFTIDAAEKQQIMSTYPEDVWKYEGVAFCASTTQTAGTKPLYRFWSDKLHGHFFTTDEQEKQHIIDAYDDSVWRYEGVAYYVQ